MRSIFALVTFSFLHVCVIAQDTAKEQIRHKADEILKAGNIYSVTFKQVISPSGNMHDYMSQGPYWWPDPTKTDGLPYIRKDGEVNPDIKKITDHDQLGKMIDESSLLTEVWKQTGDKKYALWASHLIRTWFINEATMQNPNLEFGQGIPGRTVGRGIGIIETASHPKIQQTAIELLNSPYWSTEDHATLKKWFTNYLDWLLNSEKGIDEGNTHNNHASWYDVQVASAALFIGKQDLAKVQIERFKTRLETQMAADGSQPHELERTKSWNYSNMNLNAWVKMALLAEQVDVDLWNYKAPNGRSLKLAIDWLYPYANGQKNWAYTQISDIKYNTTAEIFYWAAKKYDDPKFKTLAKKLIKNHADGLFLLTHPTL